MREDDGVCEEANASLRLPVLLLEETTAKTTGEKTRRNRQEEASLVVAVLLLVVNTRGEKKESRKRGRRSRGFEGRLKLALTPTDELTDWRLGTGF